MHQVILRSSNVLLALTMALGLPGMAVAASASSAADPQANALTATYMGQPIDPREASHYFCHTRDYPVVRCFDSQAEVDADLGWIEPQAPGDQSAAVSVTDPDGSADGLSPEFTGPYTIAYWDINYGGNSLTLYSAVSNLSALGWNDSISSIKSVNCGIPRYWTDAGYSGTYWQNGCNSWSPNLYAQNDTFSSVVNEAP
jgi:hypothetical protein